MASGSATAPSCPECFHEIKHDGYRLIARKDGERVRLWSRWGRAWTSRAAEVAEAVRRLPVTNVVLDGELLCPHDDGHSDSTRCNRRSGAGMPIAPAGRTSG